MVSGSRIEGGNGTQNLSAGVRRTIQSIKEIVGDHSDADIYSALKEANMDPNETTQKLLNQDPFHEVKRKRDKKKEVIPVKAPVPIKPRRPIEQPVQGMIKPNTFIDRNPRRPAYNNWNNNTPDTTRVSRQFRVVRDNRITQNRHREIKPPANTSSAVPSKEPSISNVSEKSSNETSKNPVSETKPVDSVSKQVKNVPSIGKRPVATNVAPPVQATKANDSVTSPNSSVVGVYSSSSDPVHIPSLVSRPAANVGAIKREVGAVGVRRHSSENSQGQFRSFPAVSKTEQPSQSNVSESVTNVPSGRSLNSQYGNRPHPQVVTHQKAPQGNKEWKPKTSQKSNVTEVGVIGTPKKPSPTTKPQDSTTSPSSQTPPQSTPPKTDQNVIIAAHIRVSESDRVRLTFGSLGLDHDSEQSHAVEPIATSPVSSQEASTGGTQIESVDERVASSGSASPVPSEQQSNERLDSQNMENYANIPNTPPPSELPPFSQAYDPQTGYDMSYLRPASDESLRGQVLQVPQEGFNNSSHNVPASTIPMVQQMYPQVHVPHYTNILPYRQYLSPVYVPPMVMPGYPNNPPTYSPHPSSSYLIMPGVNPPHKYAAIPQYKSLQAANPTAFGTFGSPNAYASASGLDESARKYKDANVYVNSPETSEMWMNARETNAYYNMGGAQTPHGAYLPSAHSANVSYNPAGQFQGMYHHPQQANAIANAHHHMGAPPGGNAGAQVGGYQQPGLSQMSWTGNF